jgi:hypothetical protein
VVHGPEIGAPEGISRAHGTHPEVLVNPVPDTRYSVAVQNEIFSIGSPRFIDGFYKRFISNCIY